jgi:drug/metabolite transporter (DMT)-like permease
MARAGLYTKLVFTTVFWGGTFIAGRIIAQQVGPFSIAFLRFLVAVAILFPVLWHSHGGLPRLTRSQIVPIVVLGLTGVFAYNVFFFTGLKTAPAGRASLIVATNPVFIALFSSFFFREPLNPLKLIGIVLCLCGAVLVISRGNPTEIIRGNVGQGELYIMGCVASWVTYSLVGKIVMTGLSPLAAVTYSSVIGGAALFFPAYFEGVLHQFLHYRPVAWACVVYLGFFGTCLGFVWYYQGIRGIGASRAGVFINLVPVSALALAFLMLGEPLEASLLAGAALVIVGIYLTNRPLPPVGRNVAGEDVRPTGTPSAEG